MLFLISNRVVYENVKNLFSFTVKESAFFMRYIELLIMLDNRAPYKYIFFLFVRYFFLEHRPLLQSLQYIFRSTFHLECDLKPVRILNFLLQFMRDICHLINNDVLCPEE